MVSLKHIILYRSTMSDLGGLSTHLAALLRHPEDLEKIPFLKSEIIRKKVAVDGQLRAGLTEQLEVTQSGITSIGDGQRAVNQIKEEMMKIDKLCAEAQNLIRDFPNINLVSQVHRNFSQVENMKVNIESFEERLNDIEVLLRGDEQDIENQPNILKVHHGLTQLRDIRDDALDQIQRASDTSLEANLQNYFTRLDDVVEWFNDHVDRASVDLIRLVQSGNTGMVVRLTLILVEEEKSDRKVKAMQDAQREYKDLASRFKSINSGPKKLRGYTGRFLKAIEGQAQAQFDAAEQNFLEEPDKLEKIFRWYFDDLYAVKAGMADLMPKKWKIFKTYTDIYHKLMHDWLIKRIDDSELSPSHVLSIIDWSEKYYVKMAKLGWNQADFQLKVLDGREIELISEYRQLIVKSVDEWMDRMFTADRSAFSDRKPDTLDNDEHGYFRTKTLGDMWRMLKEQILVAGNSGRADVAEGVVDSMFIALKTRQRNWRQMVTDESSKQKNRSAEQEGLQILQDWLVAIANDQIACIDDNEDAGQLGYLTRFQRDFESLTTPKYMKNAVIQLEGLRDGFVDAGTHCITTFVTLIFDIDFRSTISEVFTAKWYTGYAMKRMTTTFEDYVTDYQSVLHHSLRDILVEELADELLVRYLCSVCNKNAKFRRSDPFAEKLKDDVLTAFEFFQKFPEFAIIKEKWRVVNFLERMLEADKGGVVLVYEAFKKEYWDLQMSWVESVLRFRDDFDRGMLGSVKAKASEMYIERGQETIMSKVK